MNQPYPRTNEVEGTLKPLFLTPPTLGDVSASLGGRVQGVLPSGQGTSAGTFRARVEVNALDPASPIPLFLTPPWLTKVGEESRREQGRADQWKGPAVKMPSLAASEERSWEQWNRVAQRANERWELDSEPDPFATHPPGPVGLWQDPSDGASRTESSDEGEDSPQLRPIGPVGEVLSHKKKRNQVVEFAVRKFDVSLVGMLCWTKETWTFESYTSEVILTAAILTITPPTLTYTAWSGERQVWTVVSEMNCPLPQSSRRTQIVWVGTNATNTVTGRPGMLRNMRVGLEAQTPGTLAKQASDLSSGAIMVYSDSRHAWPLGN